MSFFFFTPAGNPESKRNTIIILLSRAQTSYLGGAKCHPAVRSRAQKSYLGGAKCHPVVLRCPGLFLICRVCMFWSECPDTVSLPRQPRTPCYGAISGYPFWIICTGRYPDRRLTENPEPHAIMRFQGTQKRSIQRRDPGLFLICGVCGYSPSCPRHRFAPRQPRTPCYDAISGTEIHPDCQFTSGPSDLGHPLTGDDKYFYLNYFQS